MPEGSALATDYGDPMPTHHHTRDTPHECSALLSTHGFFRGLLPLKPPFFRELRHQNPPSDRTQKGFALVATILIMSVLLAIVGVVVTLNINNLASVTGFSEHQQAKNIALLGLEIAAYNLKDDTDWTNNTTPYTGTYLGGTLTITFSAGSTNTITITSTAIYQGKEVQIQKQFQRTTNMSHNTQISTANAYFTSGALVLNDVLLSNIGTSNASITGIILTWDPPHEPQHNRKHRDQRRHQMDSQPCQSAPQFGKCSQFWLALYAHCRQQKHPIDPHL